MTNADLSAKDRALVARFNADPLATLIAEVRLVNFGVNRKGEAPKARHVLGISNCLVIAEAVRGME